MFKRYLFPIVSSLLLGMMVAFTIQQMGWVVVDGEVELLEQIELSEDAEDHSEEDSEWEVNHFLHASIDNASNDGVEYCLSPYRFSIKNVHLTVVSQPPE